MTVQSGSTASSRPAAGGLEGSVESPSSIEGDAPLVLHFLSSLTSASEPPFN